MLDGSPEVSRDVAMATNFGMQFAIIAITGSMAFCIWGAHWRHLANTTEPSVCSGDAALCQVTLTTLLSCYGRPA